jgi:hypothetical protein
MLSGDVDEHLSRRPVETADGALHHLGDMEHRHVRRSVLGAAVRLIMAMARHRVMNSRPPGE